VASPVRLERNGSILEITLDRPPASACEFDRKHGAVLGGRV